MIELCDEHLFNYQLQFVAIRMYEQTGRQIDVFINWLIDPLGNAVHPHEIDFDAGTKSAFNLHTDHVVHLFTTERRLVEKSI